MITGEIKSQINRIWDAFWSGGISNPMEVIEQMTYLRDRKQPSILEELFLGLSPGNCTVDTSMAEKSIANLRRDVIQNLEIYFWQRVALSVR
jgi:hypothetical protein